MVVVVAVVVAASVVAVGVGGVAVDSDVAAFVVAVVVHVVVDVVVIGVAGVVGVVGVVLLVGWRRCRCSVFVLLSLVLDVAGRSVWLVGCGSVLFGGVRRCAMPLVVAL